MNKFSKILPILFVLGLVLIPVAAQDTGSGGIFIKTNFGGDPNTLNPFVTSTTVESDMTQFMFPAFYAIDPSNQLPTPGARNDEVFGIAESVEISEDGTVYTFTLRDDLVWSDGTPITSADYIYMVEAAQSGVVNFPETTFLDNLASAEAPDDWTVVITLNAPSCKAMDELNGRGGLIPSHYFKELFGDDFAALNDAEYNLAPSITSGIFNFGSGDPGNQWTMVANSNHVNTVMPEGFIIRSVPDQNVAMEQFLAGEVNLLDSAPLARFQELRDLGDAGEIQFFDFVDDGMTFMGFNMADPENPQDGLDADGNAIDQGHHPLFSDVRVRKAIAHAVNMDDIINGAASGEAVSMPTFANPTGWAFNTDIQPYAYDPEGALALLAEAGFVDHDNDPSTPLQANEDALYAEPGTEFRFELLTNAGNAAREATGTIMQDQLGQIGIQVDFQAIEFGALVETLLGQTHDAIIIGFTNLDADSDGRDTFNPDSDVVGGGFNFVSYNNPAVTDLYEQALRVEGCDAEVRADLYGQAQEILADELPWFFLFSPKAAYAASIDIQNFDPFAEYMYHNLGDFSLAP